VAEMYKLQNQQKESVIKIAFIFLLCICFFGSNIYLSFATDTYATFGNFHNISELVIHSSGRVLLGLVYKLWNLCALPDEMFYFISHIAAVLLLAAAVYQFQDLLKESIAGDYYRISICFMTIANVYIIEYFMFLEKMMFLFAIFLNVAACRYTVKYFQCREMKYHLAVFVCLLSAVFTYQGTVALYVVLCLPFVYKYAGHFKGYIQKVFFVMLHYGLVCAANLFVMKVIFKSGRIHENGNFLDSVTAVIRGTVGATVFSFGIIPRFLFALFLILIFGISVISILVRYRGIKAIVQIGNLIALYAGTALISTASILFGSGWFAPRVIYPYASILGIYMVNLYVNILDGRDRVEMQYEKRTAVLISIGMLCFLSVQYLYFGKIIKDKYLNNFADCYRCKMIGEKIRDYEKETGIRVEGITFYRDGQPDLQYDGIFHEGDLVVSSFLTGWSELDAINYYLDAEYVRAEPKEEYQAYFGDRNWKVFSDEQIVFEGCTLHLCVY